MSGSATISDTDKVDIRRFCGYAAYGAGNAGFQSWRYFTQYGLLEFRLNNLTAAEVAVVQATYLVPLRTLETDILGSAARLSTSQAAVWTRNSNEVRDRTNLFTDWSRRLCAFFEIPPGPGMATSRNALRLVV